MKKSISILAILLLSIAGLYAEGQMETIYYPDYSDEVDLPPIEKGENQRITYIMVSTKQDIILSRRANIEEDYYFARFAVVHEYGERIDLSNIEQAVYFPSDCRYEYIDEENRIVLYLDWLLFRKNGAFVFLCDEEGKLIGEMERPLIFGGITIEYKFEMMHTINNSAYLEEVEEEAGVIFYPE